MQRPTIRSNLELKIQPNQILGGLLLRKTCAEFSTLEDAAMLHVEHALTMQLKTIRSIEF
jgi:hypothetical protein